MEVGTGSMTYLVGLTGGLEVDSERSGDTNVGREVEHGLWSASSRGE